MEKVIVRVKAGKVLGFVRNDGRVQEEESISVKIKNLNVINVVI